MRIAIVDDDNNFIKLITHLLEVALENTGYPESTIDAFESSQDFISGFRPHSYDLILLDIYIDSMTGVDIARTIRQTDKFVKLVFCTSSNEFATESYEVGAVNYLLKPATMESIETMLGSISKTKERGGRQIILPDGWEIDTSSISYCEYNNHVITIHFSDGFSHAVRMRQSELEDILYLDPAFYSPNRGVIINFAQVRDISSQSITLQGYPPISIARRRQRESEKAFINYRNSIPT